MIFDVHIKHVSEHGRFVEGQDKLEPQGKKVQHMFFIICFRPVCRAAEELSDLQPLWILLHRLRPLLGSVSTYRQG